VHECGHAVVLNRYGVPFSPMVFIPFMGAVIVTKERPRNSYEDAMVAFGGPVAGSLAAAAVGATGAMMDSQMLYALADFGFMINLFNLMPVGSMDGGRIGNAISPWFGVAGLGAGGLMIYQGIVHNPIFYLIMMGGTYSTVSRFLGWDDNEHENKDYYKIGATDQASILVGYLSLIGALVYAMKENNTKRKSPKQIKHEQQHGPGSASTMKVYGSQDDGVYDDYFASPGSIDDKDDWGNFK